MQSLNLAFVISQAQDERHDEPFAIAVRDSIEVGVIVPSILRTRLSDTGFTLTDDEPSLTALGFRDLAHLRRVVISDDSGIVAMGAAGDLAEALLHAALGWFREHPLPGAHVPSGIGILTKEQ